MSKEYSWCFTVLLSLRHLGPPRTLFASSRLTGRRLPYTDIMNPTEDLITYVHGWVQSTTCKDPYDVQEPNSKCLVVDGCKFSNCNYN